MLPVSEVEAAWITVVLDGKDNRYASNVVANVQSSDRITTQTRPIIRKEAGGMFTDLQLSCEGFRARAEHTRA